MKRILVITAGSLLAISAACGGGNATPNQSTQSTATVVVEDDAEFTAFVSAASERVTDALSDWSASLSNPNPASATWRRNVISKLDVLERELLNYRAGLASPPTRWQPFAAAMLAATDKQLEAVKYSKYGTEYSDIASLEKSTKALGEASVLVELATSLIPD